MRATVAGRPVLDVCRSDAASMRVHVAGVKSLGLVGGVSDPEPQGWYASADGRWTPAPVIVLRLAGRLPLLAGYAFVPRSAGVDGELALEGDAFELRARFRLGDVVHEITAVQDEVGLVTRSA